ncbi:MAG: hypothetical protein ACE5HF_00145 [Gemmatimonadota bacterium]
MIARSDGPPPAALKLLASFLLLCALAAGALAILRVLRPDRVFFYTEGPVLGSLGAYLRSGELATLYPAGGWTEPPMVATLYPPLFFWISALGMKGLGADGSLLVPRLVSLVALAGSLLILARSSRRSGAPWTWAAALLGGLMLAPSVSHLAASAQVDALALFWSVAAVGCALRIRARESVRDAAGPAPKRPWVRRAAALGLAFLAAFTKQSFVAAAIAIVAVDARGGRRRRAALSALALAVPAALAIVWLNARTGGGYWLNTASALTGSFGAASFRATIVDSRPLAWIPVLVLGAWLARRRRVPPLLGWYAAASWLLNLAASFKTGASSNYLLEPLFASVWLALASRERESTAEGADGRVSGRRRLAAGWVAAILIGVAATPGAGSVGRSLVGVWRAKDPMFRVGGLESGHPLVDAEAIPALLRAGLLPFVNDPVLFGVLHDAGLWDVRHLTRRLETREVPFVITFTDLGGGPLPEGTTAKTAGVGLSYLWRLPAVWEAVTDHYVLAGAGDSYLWTPAPDRAEAPGGS